MRLPSHSTVVAYLALFAALGGTAFAATKIGSKQIKDNSIKSRDIKNRTIATKDIAVKARNALKGQVGAQGAPGAQGERGPQGETGAPGAQGPSGVPENATVVSPTGTAIENGAQLLAALEALPDATAAAPQAVVLGVGRYDINAGVGAFAIPPYVTLSGQGPHTVVENTAANFQPVLRLGNAAVVRDLAVNNPSTTAGARGIDGASSVGNLIENVTITARTGIQLRASVLRDSRIIARTEGLRLVATPEGQRDSYVDDVNILIFDGATSDTAGVIAAEGGVLDGLEVDVFGQSVASAIRLIAADGGLDVRNSTLVAIATTAYGIEFNPAVASDASIRVDHSRAQGTGTTSYGVFATDGVVRIAHSALSGGTAGVSVVGANANCIFSSNLAYTAEVTC